MAQLWEFTGEASRSLENLKTIKTQTYRIGFITADFCYLLKNEKFPYITIVTTAISHNTCHFFGGLEEFNIYDMNYSSFLYSIFMLHIYIEYKFQFFFLAPEIKGNLLKHFVDVFF